MSQTCGDFGGEKPDGTPCGQVAGWGTDHDDGPCRNHLPASERTLSPKEREFADTYIVELNGAEAYRRSYNPDATTTTATTEAHAILGRPHVQHYIRTRLDMLFGELEQQQRAVLRRLFDMAMADIGDLMQDEWLHLRRLDELPPGASRMVKRIKETKYGIDIQLHDPLAAIKLLGQYWDLFRETHVHTGADGGPIEYREVSDDELRRRAVAASNRVAALTGGPATNGAKTNGARANGKANGRPG